jgi:hypothetical protein
VKVLPGVQQPWAVAVTTGGNGCRTEIQIGIQAPVPVARQMPNSVLDPFNSLPIEMPLKSKELFHYCE